MTAEASAPELRPVARKQLDGRMAALDKPETMELYYEKRDPAFISEPTCITVPSVEIKKYIIKAIGYGKWNGRNLMQLLRHALSEFTLFRVCIDPKICTGFSDTYGSGSSVVFS